MMRQFVAWDGEGWHNKKAPKAQRHSYFYLANSEGFSINAPRLRTEDCLQLMLRTASERPGCIHVIYGGNYDVTHWLWDMPLRWRNVLKKEGRVSWEGYRFEFIPHKWFSVAGWDKATRRWARIKVYDIMTFFQAAFIKALESRGIEVPQSVKTGKGARSQFLYSDLPFIREYTGEELRLLVLLANTLRDEFIEANLPIADWHGPGAVANAVMRKYKIGQHMQRMTGFWELLCMRAYYGGRFEQFRIGHYDGTCYQADLHGAYASKIRNLPSLKGARWEKREHFTGELGIWRCDYQAKGNLNRPHPLPWRSNSGSVGFPAQVWETYVWTWEAQHANVLDGYALVLDTDVKPFAFVDDLYTTRMEWKKQGRGGHFALKHGYNSLYGKCAQRVGGRNGNPPTFHQLAWAGMTCSQIRADMYTAGLQAGDSIIAFETDSITTTEKLDLPYTEGTLGTWELTEFDWMTYLQSGMYWSSRGTKLKERTRGVRPEMLSHDRVIRWLSGRQSDPLQVWTQRFYSITAPQDAKYGQWEKVGIKLSGGNGKRIHVPNHCPECNDVDRLRMSETMHHMTPNALMGLGPSKPHPLPWRKDVNTNIGEEDTEPDYE